VFDVRLYRNENAEPTVFRSKAVGEPPLLLAFSVFLALRDALAGVAPDARHAPPLEAPATPEALLTALTKFVASTGDGTNDAAPSNESPAAEGSPSSTLPGLGAA
jgi:xanthine dehydrogenase large subunit